MVLWLARLCQSFVADVARHTLAAFAGVIAVAMTTAADTAIAVTVLAVANGDGGVACVAEVICGTTKISTGTAAAATAIVTVTVTAATDPVSVVIAIIAVVTAATVITGITVSAGVVGVTDFSCASSSCSAAVAPAIVVGVVALVYEC